MQYIDTLQNYINKVIIHIKNRKVFEMQKDMFGLLFLAFLIMVIIAPFFDNQDQVNIYSGFISLTINHNLYYSYIYSYPPLAEFLDWPFLSILSSIYPTGNWIVSLVSAKGVVEQMSFLTIIVFSPLFNLFYKLPMILATLITSMFLFKTVIDLGFDYSKAKQITAIYLFNPFVIYEASIHSPIDCYVPLLIMIFLYSLFKKKPFLSGLISSIGALIIVFPIYFLILSIFYYLIPITLKRERRLKEVRKNILLLIIGTSIPIILTLPYLENFFFLSKLLTTHSSLLINMSNIDFWGALNSSFGIFPIISNNITEALSLLLRSADLFIFSLIGALMGVLGAKGDYKIKSQSNTILNLFTLSMILLFISDTGATPQAFIWFLILLLLVSIYKSSVFITYIAVSAWGLIWESLFLVVPFYYLLSFSTFFDPSLTNSLIGITLTYWSHTWGSSLHPFLWNFTSIFGGTLILFTVYLLIRNPNSAKP